MSATFLHFVTVLHFQLLYLTSIANKNLDEELHVQADLEGNPDRRCED